MSAPREVRAAVVRGLWRGDGYRNPERSYFVLSTRSQHLAYQSQELLASLGIVSGITSRTAPGKKRAFHVTVTAEFVAPMAALMGLRFEEQRNRTASHFIIDDEYVFTPIRSIESTPVYDVMVHNLEVEEDQTYLAAGTLVHNCVKKCPFDAIRIIGLPEPLKEDLVHQYSKNGFRLLRRAVPKAGAVVGLVGPNGIGKTTLLSILSGELCPNLGHYRRTRPYWNEVLEKYKGTEAHEYLEKIVSKEIRTALKPQYVDKLPKVAKGTVGDLLKKVDDQGRLDELSSRLYLDSVLHRDIAHLSGGELQRTAIAATMLKDADVYFFDEPSSYLDIYQRLEVAKVIQTLSKEKYVVVVEHDLAVLDFLADSVYLLYGSEGAYGVVAQPRAVRTGINVYLGGFLKEENIRFRDREVTFESRPPRKDWRAETLVTFDRLEKEFPDFSLTPEADIYLIDEPSADLASNQRMAAARTIRRVMENQGRTGLIVDHDVYFIDMVADSIMVFSGEPGVRGHGEGPFPMREGMNRFLELVGVTFRRDPDTNRPRINKLDSRLDREQKHTGEYYYALA